MQVILNSVINNRGRVIREHMVVAVNLTQEDIINNPEYQKRFDYGDFGMSIKGICTSVWFTMAKDPDSESGPVQTSVLIPNPKIDKEVKE